MAMHHGYASWLCIMAMYHGYASLLCIMAMYHGYRMQFFEKMSQSVLNQVLTLPDYRTQQILQIPLKIVDLQNDLNMFVAKQWKFIISVPMSYMRLFENLAVLEKWYLKGT